MVERPGGTFKFCCEDEASLQRYVAHDMCLSTGSDEYHDQFCVVQQKMSKMASYYIVKIGMCFSSKESFLIRQDTDEQIDNLILFTYPTSVRFSIQIRSIQLNVLSQINGLKWKFFWHNLNTSFWRLEETGEHSEISLTSPKNSFSTKECTETQFNLES